MNLSLKMLEKLLLLLLANADKLRVRLAKVDNDIVVLQQLTQEMRQAQAAPQQVPTTPVSSRTFENTYSPAPCNWRSQGERRIIEAADVHDFLHRASLFLDNLQHHFHIYIKYAWFCQFICLRFSLRRQRGGIPGSDLSPTTILSYFKRERAGEF